MGDTRAKIDIIAGTIELEGSETFVTKYLDEFKSLLDTVVPARGASVPNAPVHETKVATSKDRKAEIKTPAVAKKTGKKRNGAPKLSAEKYDIHGNGNAASLQAFFDEKKPGRANGDRIAVIGYYITEVLGNKCFTEGQVEYSYKMLKLDRPGHLHQIMINNKNEKDYYEEAPDGEAGHWAMTRGGDIFVTDQLPRNAE